MSKLQSSERMRRLGKVIAGLVATCLMGGIVNAQEVRDEVPTAIKVFVHPDKLTAKDKLTDGESGKAIEIKSETTLIWVDLMPDARFGHPTEYVLISSEGTRVVKGSRRPILNGKPLFRDGKQNVEK